MTARRPTRTTRQRTEAPPAAERARTVATCASAWVHTPGTGTSSLLAATTTAGGDVLLVGPR